jgi:hypothetical protein
MGCTMYDVGKFAAAHISSPLEGEDKDEGEI